MKLCFSLMLFLLITNILTAQFVITPGAQVSLVGSSQLTLQNMSLVNNGSFNAGVGITTFAGNLSSTISGSQPLQFYELEMNKSNNIWVALQKSIGVTQRILFSSGLLNLNGFNADLGNTGHLDGEQENTRVIGPNGGEILFNVNLNQAANFNLANLGVFITSNQNLGHVIIKRGHQSQANPFIPGTSILRYYDISSTNNTNLNATLRFNYFDNELNGLDEDALVLLQSQTLPTWINSGFNIGDVVANYVEKTGVKSFGRFTLSNANGTLPLHFILLNAKCEGSKIVVNWKTAQEQNSSYLNIESSVDGTRWKIIGNVLSTGNSRNETTYSFTDNDPAENSSYRIAAYDSDGKVQYSTVVQSSCAAKDVFKLWPNPVHNFAFVSILSSDKSGAIIKVFDSKGVLVKMQQTNLLQGNNQFNIDMKSIASGIYQVVVVWNDGKTQKTLQVIKQ